MMLRRILYELGFAVDTEPGVSIADMGVNGERRKPEAVADFFFGQAVIDQSHDPLFGGAELMVELRTTDYMVIFALSAERAVDLLKIAEVVGADVRNGVKSGKIAPDKATHNPKEEVRPIEGAALIFGRHRL